MKDKEMDYKRMRELWEEFGAHYDQLHAFYHDAVAGLIWFKERVLSDQEMERARYQGTEIDSDDFWDSKRLSYDRIFGQDFVASGLHVGTVREAGARNEPGGSNFTTLANVCIVTLYDYWDNYLRREYCKAKGYHKAARKDLREQASFDLWGDIRLLRNSIVHNRGTATDKMQDCKVIRFFEPGDLIAISPQQMRAKFLELYRFRNYLHAESLKKTTIWVPG